MYFYFLNNLISVPHIFETGGNLIFQAFYDIYEISDFIEVTLRINLIIEECGREIVALIEVFDGAILRAYFFSGDTENGGGIGRESQFFHLREAIGT